MSKNGGTDADVQRRIGLATTTFQKMRKIWATKSVNLTTKIRLYRSCVVPIATYASETWRATKMITHRLNVFNQKCLRKILGISFSDHIKNEEVLKRSEVETIADLIKQKRVRWAGHVLRMPECRHPKTAFSWKPRSGKRRQGRPLITWRATCKKDLQTIGVDCDDAARVASDRELWKILVALCDVRQDTD